MPPVFTVYQGGGWTIKQVVPLTSEEWQGITEPLTRIPKSVEEERQALKDTTARFEKIMGAKAGTANDVGGIFGNMPLAPTQMSNGSLQYPPDLARIGQQDCVDEFGTLQQLIFALQAGGLLQYHVFDANIVKTWIGPNYPHFALSIFEKETPEKVWVVDSWVQDNGLPPDILPLEEWERKWNNAINKVVNVSYESKTQRPK